MKIKECPFCGGEARIAKTELTTHSLLVWVKCICCHHHTASIKTASHEEQAIQESIERWNRRAV